MPLPRTPRSIGAIPSKPRSTTSASNVGGQGSAPSQSLRLPTRSIRNAPPVVVVASTVEVPRGVPVHVRRSTVPSAVNRAPSAPGAVTWKGTASPLALTGRSLQS